MILEFPIKSRRILERLGFNVENNEVTTRAKLLVMLCLFMCGQAIASLANKWEDQILRFQLFEDVVITLVSCMVFAQYTIDPASIGELLSLAEESYYQYIGVHITEEEERFKRRTIKEINAEARFIGQLLQVDSLVIILTPVMHISFMIFITGQIKIESLRFDQLPLPLAFTQKCTNIFTYTIVYIVQSFYIYWFLKVGYCMYSSIMFGTRRVASEARLLFIVLNRFDFQNKTLSDSDLRMTFQQIIFNINFIYRKRKILNEKVSFIITMENYVLTSMICLSIYSFIQVSNNLLKLRHFIQTLVCVFLLYVYSANGQQLINESERMYDSLGQLSWYDKPEWFKKNLLFLLTRSSRRLEVKPYGLYVLDLRNFAVVMNAAYTYFNFLNNRL